MKFIYTLVFTLITLVLSGSQTHAQELPREFRGVWMATVENIDWPSAKNLSSKQQQKEIIAYLDFFKSLNFNAIIFQVRPAADAFYNSQFEPWSEWLTGTKGTAPAPYYDPLAFIIEETHKRGMEFHAWMNPYRAIVNNSELAKTRLQEEHPNWFLSYGNTLYFNPGIPDVRKYTTKIVADLVQNYNIDALHFDDYFYPYTIADTPFPDEDSFKKFGGSFYPNELAEWRRSNVNAIILDLRTKIKSVKPWVQFGISPFGVWRNKSVDPNGSDTKAGQTNYDDLYADIVLWLKNGWLDYVLPQIYWHIGFDLADYTTVASWWNAHSYDTNLYIGHAMYRQTRATDGPWKEKNPSEIQKQLNFNTTLSNIKGSAFFSANSFMDPKFNLTKILQQRYYARPLLPPTPHKNNGLAPEAVQQAKLTKLKRKQYALTWNIVPENESKIAVKFLVFQFNKNETINLHDPHNLIALTGEKELLFTKKSLKEKGAIFVIIPVNRQNLLGKEVVLK